MSSPTQAFDLTGKTALVTGASRGLGKHFAITLARAGADVAITSRTLDSLEGTAAEIKALGRKVVPVALDVRDKASIDSAVNAVHTQFGKIDILINNAGGQFPAPVEKISINGWRAVVENNLNGTFLMTKVVGERAMLPAGSGRIVNIVANMWRGFPGMAHTGAARAGVVNLTQSLAVEWASRGVLVNAVAPGTVRSTGTDRYPPELMKAAIAATPLKRMGTPEDVSRAVMYLCSPAGDWITGETLCVDGGARLWGDIWQIP